MPVVRLNDSTFLSLKTIATWNGISTPAAAIDYLVSQELVRLDLEKDDEPDTNEKVDDFIKFQKTPGLMHTKIIEAQIDKKYIENPNWANVLAKTILAVKKRGFEKTELVSQLEIPSTVSRFENKGYTHHSDIGISFQGQSAQDAWVEAERLAQKHNIPIKIHFRWREKEGAQYPGKQGILEVTGA